METMILGRSPDYYCNVRQFANGSVELMTKCVRPMQRDAFGERWKNFFPIKARASSPEEMTPEELEAKKRANWQRSIRRARQNIRWSCKEMSADRLLTLTYRCNMTDREIAMGDWKEFCRLVRVGGYPYRAKDGSVRRAAPQKGWRYIAVLEKQDRGALHIHVAVQGYQQISMLRAAWYLSASDENGVRSHDALAVGADTPGAVNVTSPRNMGKNRREWKTNQLAGYITKYLDKTFDEAQAEKKRYWKSRDLKTPGVFRFWLGATNVKDAIIESYKYADGVLGLCAGDSVTWLSPDKTTFWLAGMCYPENITGAPF